jgi:hypothetical protein
MGSADYGSRKWGKTFWVLNFLGLLIFAALLTLVQGPPPDGNEPGPGDGIAAIPAALTFVLFMLCNGIASLVVAGQEVWRRRWLRAIKEAAIFVLIFLCWVATFFVVNKARFG